MRRRTFLTLGNQGISASEAMACDVCLYNKTTQKLLIVKSSDFNSTTYPKTNYSPVGVVVIPGTHNVYGTGECAVMSLKGMYAGNPKNGGNDTNMYWGVTDNDISTIKNYGGACYVGNGGVVNKTVQGISDNTIFPSDKFSTVQNPYDTDTYYVYNVQGYYHYIPSPYNDDDTRNTIYYQTKSPSSTSNALSDFDGRGNTTKILAVRGTKESSSWTPSYEADYPAASCCDMYRTDGTNQGDWYLPSFGELGYMMVKFNKINQAIQTLKSAYGVGVKLDESYTYITSTECDGTIVLGIATGYGSFNIIEKNSVYFFTRAFLRVK